MAKKPTTIRYVDRDTGRTHTIEADVEQGATRAQVAAALERINNLPAGRIRITRGV